MTGFFVCLFAVISLQAQTPNRGKITARIVNDKQEPVENATVELVKVKDSSLVKIALTDKTGLAEFENIVFGTYLVRSKTINYSIKYSGIIDLSPENTSVQSSALILQPASGELGNVTVNSRKPFIQKLTDRIVVNVENSIVSAGSSAMDVLERSPGVNIDNNDVISLRGRSGVIIMIDGKPTAMSGADLANYLRGLPSAAIERIDIITNPSAKYDAAGNSGIIDIRMKKDQRLGTNGTFTAGYGQGV